jgi:DNA-directed RNA polymerase subunit L
VQTNGKKAPITAVKDALTDLRDEVQDIREQFTAEVARVQPQQQAY